MLNQDKVKELSTEDGLILLCGRYEGIDQRVIDFYDFEEVSIGNYVISGGESATFVLLESVLRLLPGVLGGNETLNEESSPHLMFHYHLKHQEATLIRFLIRQKLHSLHQILHNSLYLLLQNHKSQLRVGLCLHICHKAKSIHLQ